VIKTRISPSSPLRPNWPRLIVFAFAAGLAVASVLSGGFELKAKELEFRTGKVASKR